MNVLPRLRNYTNFGDAAGYLFIHEPHVWRMFPFHFYCETCNVYVRWEGSV